MLIRAVITLVCLASLAWYLDREQNAGRFQHTDEVFLDFLVANTRAQLEKPDPQAANGVVFVQMREEDASEYASWPPPPIDWQTLLKALQAYHPQVLVLATPPNWGNPSPDFVPAVAEALIKHPSVVLAVEAESTTPDNKAPPFLGGLDEVLPKFQRVSGDVHSAAALAALITAPDPALRNYGELGLLSMRQDDQKRWHLPYALRSGETLIPSVLAQTLAREVQTPYAMHRLRLGAGAGAYLNQGRFVPLEPNGDYLPTPDQQIVTINALNLMTGTLTDGMSAQDREKLEHARIIVLGLEGSAASNTPPSSRVLTQALTQASSLPHLDLLQRWQQWLALGLALLAGSWLVLKGPKGKALRYGLGLIFAAFVISFLLFQSQLMWFPPTVPVAILAAATVLAMITSRFPSASKPVLPPVEEVPAAA